MSSEKTKEKLMGQIVALIPLRKIGQFKTEVFDLIKSWGVEEISSQQLEQAISMIAKKWEA